MSVVRSRYDREQERKYKYTSQSSQALPISSKAIRGAVERLPLRFTLGHLYKTFNAESGKEKGLIRAVIYRLAKTKKLTQVGNRLYEKQIEGVNC